MNAVENDDLATLAMRLLDELYPICRSITGDGVRATLGVLSRLLPVDVREVPSGTPVLDWIVPPEWNIDDAYIADASGRRVVDFADSNLHVVSYSVPVSARMTLDELRPASAHAPGPARPDPVPDLLLRRGLGVLPQSAPTRHVGARRVRGAHRLPAGAGVAELRRGRGPRATARRRSSCRPTSVTRRWPTTTSPASPSRRCSPGACSTGRAPRHTFRFVYAPGTIGAITWLARNRERGGADPSWTDPHLPRAIPIPSPTSGRSTAGDRSTAPPRHVSPRAAWRTSSSTSSRTATTSASTTRPGSACPSVR